jgi:hypothetical protein
MALEDLQTDRVECDTPDSTGLRFFDDKSARLPIPDHGPPDRDSCQQDVEVVPPETAQLSSASTCQCGEGQSGCQAWIAPLGVLQECAQGVDLRSDHFRRVHRRR